jgi:hypothetical protein
MTFKHYLGPLLHVFGRCNMLHPINRANNSARLLAVGIMLISVTAIAAAILFGHNVRIANAQQLASIPAVIENGTFQNTEDGIRLRVPDGWVVQDIDNLHIPNYLAADETGFLLLAIICPQQEALPGVGGLYDCEQSNSSVEIRRDRLGHRPEFEVIEDPLNITSDDFLAFMMEEMHGRNYSNIQIVNSADLAINVTSPDDTNTTTRMVPAKFVEMTYQPSLELAAVRSYSILATIPETPQPGLRQIVSGYSFTYEGPAAGISSGNPPPPVKQMFHSLEFIR